MPSTATKSASMRPTSQSTCKSPRPLTAWMRFSSRSISGWILMVASPLPASLALRRFCISCAGMFLTVERQYHFRVLERRFDMNRTLPELVKVREGVLGVIGLQLDAAVAMLEKHLAAVFVVAVLDVNNRPADVREIKQ